MYKYIFLIYLTNSFLTKYLYILLILLTAYIFLTKYLSYFFTSYKAHLSQSTHTYFPYIFSIHNTRSISHKLSRYTFSYILKITYLLKNLYIFILYLTNPFPTKYLYIIPINITNTICHKTYIFLTISIHLKRYQTLFQ